MSGIHDHVPFSVERIKDLARVLGVGQDMVWINPMTGAMDLRDAAAASISSQVEVESESHDGYTTKQ